MPSYTHRGAGRLRGCHLGGVSGIDPSNSFHSSYLIIHVSSSHSRPIFRCMSIFLSFFDRALLNQSTVHFSLPVRTQNNCNANAMHILVNLERAHHFVQCVNPEIANGYPSPFQILAAFCGRGISILWRGKTHQPDNSPYALETTHVTGVRRIEISSRHHAHDSPRETATCSDRLRIQSAFARDSSL